MCFRFVIFWAKRLKTTLHTEIYILIDNINNMEMNSCTNTFKFDVCNKREVLKVRGADWLTDYWTDLLTD